MQIPKEFIPMALIGFQNVAKIVHDKTIRFTNIFYQYPNKSPSKVKLHRSLPSQQK